MKLNMAKLKKVSDDDHSAVLRHDDGHEIRIAKKGLSGSMKNQLSGIPLHFDEGGMIPGTQVASNDPQYMSGGSSVFDTIDQPMSSMGPGPSAGPAPESPPMPAGQRLVSPQEMYSAQPEAVSQVPTAITPNVEAMPAKPQGPQNYTLSGPAPASTGPAMQDPMSQSLAGYQGMAGRYEAGLRGEAKAIGDLGKSQADIYNQQANDMKALQDLHQKQTAPIYEEIAKIRHDIDKGHLDPNHYLNSLSGGKKIMTAIGLIMGGIGSGLTGQPSVAAQFINNQIDRDIDAQKAEFGKKHTLLEDNYKLLGNMKDAMDMTRVTNNYIVGAQLAKSASQAQEPIMKSRLQKEAAQWNIEHVQPLMMKINQSRFVQGVQNLPPEKVDQAISMVRGANPEMAKEMETRYVPGVGMASVPVPNDVREKIIASANLDKQLNALEEFSKTHSGSLDPKIREQGKVMALSAMDAYRTAKGQGVFKPAEAEFVEGVIPKDPTAFFNNYRTTPAYQKTAALNRGFLNDTFRGYGLKPPSYAAPNQNAPANYRK